METTKLVIHVLLIAIATAPFLFVAAFVLYRIVRSGLSAYGLCSEYKDSFKTTLVYAREQAVQGAYWENDAINQVAKEL